MRVIGDILRALLRLLALIIFAIGAAALAAIAYFANIGNGALTNTLGQGWFTHHVASLNLIQAVVQRRLHPLIWDNGIVVWLGWPAWVALLVLLAVALLVGGIIWTATQRAPAGPRTSI